MIIKFKNCLVLDKYEYEVQGWCKINFRWLINLKYQIRYSHQTHSIKYDIIIIIKQRQKFS